MGFNELNKMGLNIKKIKLVINKNKLKQNIDSFKSKNSIFLSVIITKKIKYSKKYPSLIKNTFIRFMNFLDLINLSKYSFFG